MAKRKQHKRRIRDTTRVTPYHVVDKARGISVHVDTLRYWRAPETVTRPVAAKPKPVLLSVMLAAIEREHKAERERDRLALPNVFRKTVVIPARPPAPYRPRETRDDFSGLAKPGRDPLDDSPVA